jgi:hypothetical protein
LNSIDFPLLGLEYYGGYGLIAGVGRWDFQGLTNKLIEHQLQRFYTVFLI